VMSQSVETAMNRILEHPTTCPHGNPIPGSGYLERDLITLSTLAVGDAFTITRIPEELEFTPGLLDFLEDNDILPGRSGTVDAASPDGTLTVTIEKRTVGIGSFAGARILVTAA
jgi:DtxR family Mn-dependent transcriptional regulator